MKFNIGHMMQVGYDTYCKLLDEVVKEMQGIEVKQEQEQDVQIDLNISSYIPDEFISNSNQKIEIYQNISLCKTEKDIQNVIDEIIDRFGRLPYQIENLIQIIRIKNLSQKANITKIIQKQNNITYFFDGEKFNIDIVDKMVKIYKNKIKFSPAQEPYITLKIDDIKEYKDEIKDKKLINMVKNFLEQIV